LYKFLDEIKNRELLEQELDIARTIQKSFLPQEIKEFKGINISSFLQPAKFVAGDLFDILIIDEERIGIFIGDVAGKGIPASLIMAQTISLFRVFARQYPDSSRVLARLNKELWGKFGGRFVTCIYMIIDAAQNRVEATSAGHAPLLFYSEATDKLAEIDLEAGLPVGVMEEVEYKVVKFNIGKGDKIVVFTDGLLESRNKKSQEFGLDHTKKVILENAGFSSGRILEAVKEAVFSFSYHCPQHDDITLIVLSR
jgi:sigma-B regulation protein RsbU (phosphoserine phosphatase)